MEEDLDEDSGECIGAFIDLSINDDDVYFAIDSDDDDDCEAEPEERSGKRVKNSHRDHQETIEEWINDRNVEDPVPEDDPDMLRFQQKMHALIKRITEHASSSDDKETKAWMCSPDSEREMTRGFRTLLMRVDAEELANATLPNIPNKAQQILGREDVKPIDLLSLPRVSGELQHRMTYVNIPVRVGASNIQMAPAPFQPGLSNKTATPGFDYEDSMEAKVYIGSTLNRRGGWFRISEHQQKINRGNPSKATGIHYAYARQPDVLPNFRAIGVWPNPHMMERKIGDQDLIRWLPVFIEGLLMVYLGTYHRRVVAVPHLEEHLEEVLKHLRGQCARIAVSLDPLP